MVPREQTSDPQGSDLVYGWLNPASAEKDARDNDDVIVVSGMTGEPPSVRASFALGALEVALVAGGAVEVAPWETSRQWQGVVVGYLISGSMRVSQDERTVALAPGDVVLYTGAHGYRLSAPGAHEYLLVRIPTSLLALRHGELTTLLAADLTALGSTPLLRAVMSTLASPESQPSAAAAGHVADALVAAVHAVLADGREPGTATVLSLFHSLALWIEEHLQDAELDAARIAHAHELSPRAVRRVFAANGVTVSSLVRERRLERIRDELVDPAHARESIGTIAARWGFPDPATLSSAFTRRYGASPRRYRADLQRQGQPGAAD
jgi:AraC-like DNA-binding protein